MKRLFTLSVYLLLCLAAYNQGNDSVSIKGQILPVTSKFLNPKVNLVPYNPNDEYYSAPINPDGTFSFKIPVSSARLYDMKYGGYSKYLLLTPAEPAINYLVQADGDKVNLMKSTGSVENKAYFEFRQAVGTLEENLKGLKQNAQRNSSGYENKVTNSISTFNTTMNALRQQYSNTYTAAVLSHVASLHEIDRTQPLLQQLQQHFFDNVDWTNFLLYNTPDVDRKMTFYLDNIADTSVTGELDFINSLYTVVKKEPMARQQLTNLFFTQLVNNLRESYLQTYVNWILGQPFVSSMPVLAAKIKQVSKVLPGNKAFDVKGENINGTEQNLYAELKEHKLTMLLFWESECSHCRQSMPEFKRLYNDYHNKGFEIFAASMDVSKEKWKEFVSKNDLKWQNILLPSGSEAHADYYLQYTPTMVLIDNQGIILHRFIDVEDLRHYISEYLGD